MQVAVSLPIGHSAAKDWDELVAYTLEAERLGAAFVWSAEAWNQDALTPLAYLAAKTARIRLGSGIVQAGTRTPALLGMTAMTLAQISGDRFTRGLGAMGSKEHNFYNDAYRRAGYEEEALRVQALWLDGRREEARAVVPDELVLQSNLLGTEAMVRERLRLYRDAGITTLRLSPAGASQAERLDTLGRAIALVNEVPAERVPAPA
jgi:Luciferase-like monooxygenase